MKHMMVRQLASKSSQTVESATDVNVWYCNLNDCNGDLPFSEKNSVNQTVIQVTVVHVMAKIILHV